MYFLDEKLKPISHRLNHLTPPTFFHPITEMPELPQSLHEWRNKDTYSVTIEKDPNRPVGKLYKSRCLNE